MRKIIPVLLACCLALAWEAASAEKQEDRGEIVCCEYAVSGEMENESFRMQTVLYAEPFLYRVQIGVACVVYTDKKDLALFFIKPSERRRGGRHGSGILFARHVFCGTFSKRRDRMRRMQRAHTVGAESGNARKNA